MDDIQKLARLYQEAEEILKEIEREIQEGLVVPAINELRYAGFHLLQALNSDDQNIRADQIVKAENHAKRAIYDAVEVGVLDKLGALKRFQCDYSMVCVTDVIPDFVNRRTRIRKIQLSIDEHNMHSRADHYQECMEHYRELTGMVDELEDARPELNKKMRMRRNAMLAFLATIAITLVASMPSFINFLNNREARPATAQPAYQVDENLDKDVKQKKPTSQVGEN